MEVGDRIITYPPFFLQAHGCVKDLLCRGLCDINAYLLNFGPLLLTSGLSATFQVSPFLSCRNNNQFRYRGKGCIKEFPSACTISISCPGRCKHREMSKIGQSEIHRICHIHRLCCFLVFAFLTTKQHRNSLFWARPSNRVDSITSQPWTPHRLTASGPLHPNPSFL